MCGIFGFRISSSQIHEKNTQKLLKDLFLYSESRGKEASGISVIADQEIKVIKSPLPASKLLLRAEFKNLLSSFFSSVRNNDAVNSYFAIGHSRLVTNGGQQNNSNNQPVISNNMVAIHNGIITNVDELWKSYSFLKRSTELDTEVFLSIFRHLLDNGKSIEAALSDTYTQIEGVASIAIQLADYGLFLLATNNGSVYYLASKEPGIFIFASEKHILNNIAIKHPFCSSCQQIQHLEPGTAILMDFSDSQIKQFVFDTTSSNGKQNSGNIARNPHTIIDLSNISSDATDISRFPGQGPYYLPGDFDDIYPEVSRRVAELKRCTRCILPETMPFIEFDGDGICNYCRFEDEKKPLGMDALMDAMAPYRNNTGDPECLITFSGGRDSSFGLHFVTEVLKMRPVTYTYDWGMITDLGRRNQMRMCGKLGIENILVSADIAKKRRNIRLNISAWLKQPDLGTVPLFMAGDKQYFYYANLVGKQTGCKIIVLCENLLETTRFKTGFCDISPHFGSQHTYSLSLGDKFKLLSYYGKRFVGNPSYLNSSLVDTLGAYMSYYFLPHNYLNLYEYIQWDESEINDTLKAYNWETASDTKSTWRIGDGTASFYNYIYYTMSGLTENDTFRSNQIRAGFLSREEALDLVNEENVPRYNSIQWYCDVIGLDFISTMKRINNSTKLYKIG
ncbi:MAG: hypothetical protein AB9891_18245 [Anaerolineaceae bacterium]